MSGVPEARAAEVRGLAAAPDSWRVPATAMAAVESIRAWRASAEVLFAQIQARVMEACAVIKKEHPGEMAFMNFVNAHLGGVLDARQAWQMANVWEAARGNRELRELATRKPDEAIQFVSEFVAGPRSPADLIGEHGREAARILTAPPGRRSRMVRDLLAADRAARESRHPDDVRRIGELEAENGLLRDEARQAPPGDVVRDAAAALHRMEREAAEIEERLRGRVLGLDGALRSRLLDAADGLVRRIDAISGQAIDHDETHSGDDR